METQPPNKKEESLVISYLFLRKSVGVLGFSLPIVLVVGGFWIGQCADIQASISDYYHTIMRDVFVGMLCAIALFLFSYNGYDSRDRRAGILGCIFALGIAFFPTANDYSICTIPTSFAPAPLIGQLHLLFATLFFLVLTYFALFLFTETSKKNPTDEKRKRNKVYIVCGYTMLGCIVAIAVYKLFMEDKWLHLNAYNPIFWLETIALWAFAVSWLIKGELLLKDQ
ncbi:MAG: hypothetical protein R2822_14830 [Spirosomataceae bacterium]